MTYTTAIKWVMHGRFDREWVYSAGDQFPPVTDYGTLDNRLAPPHKRSLMDWKMYARHTPGVVAVIVRHVENGQLQYLESDMYVTVGDLYPAMLIDADDLDTFIAARALCGPL